ncbi:MAG: glycosyltransferase family 117 protein [Candidatus Promineifilaceae bacterium]
METLVRDSTSAFRKPAAIAPLLVAILAFGTYAGTVATDLTWSNYGGDSGELVTAAVTLGVPHPPGYPLYVVLGKIFATVIPIGTIAFRLNLLSAILMSVAAGFLTATMINLMPPDKKSSMLLATSPYVAAGLSFALTPLAWGQANVTEVYPLALALLAALLWTLVSKRALKRPVLTGMLFGAALTAHLTAILALPMLAGLVPWRRWHHLAVGLLIGLMPFLILPILSLSQSPVSWGEARTLEGWWWLVSARLYHPNVLSLPRVEWAARLAQWAPQFVRQYTIVGLPLALLGVGICWSRAKRFTLMAVVTCAVFMIYAYLYRTPDAFVYLLPVTLLVGLMVGCSLIRARWFALLLPLALLALNLQLQDTQTVASIRGLAYGLLSDLDQDAVVITQGEPTIFALWYFQHVEGMRPDVVLVDADLFQFDWYRRRLTESHPELRGLGEDDLDRFETLNVSARPICHASLVRATPTLCSRGSETVRIES